MQQNGYRPQYIAKDGGKAHNTAKLAVVLLLAVVIAGAIFALSAFNSDERKAYNASRSVFLDNISVNGIDVGGMMYNDAWNLVMDRAQSAQHNWTLDIVCNGFTYATATYDTVGITTDYAMLEQILIEAWQYGHGTFKQYKADVEALRETPYNKTLTLPEGSYEHVDYILSIIAENVYRAPQDAAFLGFDAENAANPFVFRPEIPGQQIDMEEARTEILRRAYAGEGGVYDIPLRSVAPAVTMAELQKSTTLLAEGKNAIDKHSTKERNENISLALGKINGFILEPGKTFSFNKVVGARSEENGYLSAVGYVSGELREVTGGGVCQASTTLYSAALCAGLTITERTPHSMPVSYIELGQDATVNFVRGHMIDLKFKNETGAPVYIVAQIEKSEAGRLMSVVRVYGQAHEEGIHYRVHSVEVETLPIPEEVVIRKDKNGTYVKYTDQTYTYSKGSEGHVVNTYLQKMNGTTVVEETLISTDTYDAQPVIQYVGVTKRS